MSIPSRKPRLAALPDGATAAGGCVLSAETTGASAFSEEVLDRALDRELVLTAPGREVSQRVWAW